ncbi:hypothetical protein CRYUN_Cryun04dG0034300 [Craigia yunnanensis]
MADYTLYYSQCTPACSQPCLMADCPMSSNRRSCVNHFSHKHPLRPIKVEAEEELICSGCGLDLSGSALKCSKSNCEFILHKSCFNLEPVLQHNYHPDHPLTLLSTPPKYYRNKLFICDACGDHGTSFDYHCSSCQLDLHVGCAFSPKTMNHVDHQHPLTLFYSSSCNRGNDNVTFICDVCNEVVPKKHWVYYCEKCDYGTHLLCTIPAC